MINEDDLKKVILMLKLSKPYLSLPPQDLFLTNLWRVAPKLADKLMRQAKLVLIQNKGRITLKPAEEVPADATIIGTGVVSISTKQREASEKPVEEVTEETPKEETPQEVTESAPEQPITEETEKTPHRCRKRKSKEA